MKNRKNPFIIVAIILFVLPFLFMAYDKFFGETAMYGGQAPAGGLVLIGLFAWPASFIFLIVGLIEQAIIGNKQSSGLASPNDKKKRLTMIFVLVAVFVIWLGRELLDMGWFG